MASPPVLVVEWACGECGESCPTAEEAAVHCDASWWEAIEAARNLELAAARA